MIATKTVSTRKDNYYYDKGMTYTATRYASIMYKHRHRNNSLVLNVIRKIAINRSFQFIFHIALCIKPRPFCFGLYVSSLT